MYKKKSTLHEKLRLFFIFDSNPALDESESNQLIFENGIFKPIFSFVPVSKVYKRTYLTLELSLLW